MRLREKHLCTPTLAREAMLDMETCLIGCDSLIGIWLDDRKREGESAVAAERDEPEASFV